jgi:hypothetical protein
LKQKKPTLGEQLAFLSVKYSVYPAELFQALVSARENGKFPCEDLTVEYRGSIDAEAIFLIKKDNNVIVQFRVAEELLLKKEIPFENWMDTDKIRRQIAKQNPATFFILIRDLRTGMKKVNVDAEVLETPKPSLVHTQHRDDALVTNVWIGDETGKIKLCLWDKQVDAVAVGDTIQIKNANVASFMGERQVRLGKSGTLSVLKSRAASIAPQAKNTSKDGIYS